MSRLGVLMWRYLFETVDARRLRKQHREQDISDLHITKDIPYITDGDRGHLLDIYELPQLPKHASVMINIHGGGLFASYKEVNALFNYEWARLGYRVINISYRRIPQVRLWQQINDVMVALRFCANHAQQYRINTQQCYIIGDSAGALLSLFALALNKNAHLQQQFGIVGSALNLRAGGLISIMLATQRRDVLRTLADTITDERDAGKGYEQYLLQPSLLIGQAQLPPLFLVTSVQDLIQTDTLHLDRLLTYYGVPHILQNYSKRSVRKLNHVFAVCYPTYPESRHVFACMDSFFQRCAA